MPPSIFISYSSKDIKIAEKLETELKEAGFNDLWRDKRKIEKDWSREIALALAESDVICLLWTKNSTESPWVKNEWLTARALEKLIVLCLPSSDDFPELPKPLQNCEGVKYQKDRKEEYNFENLVKHLKQKITAFHVKHDYTILPQNSLIPLMPDPNFTGRHMEMLDLYLAMIGNLNKIGTNTVGITGMGGLGKTALAVEFGWRFSYAFSDGGVFWIQAADPNTSLLEKFAFIAKERLKLKIRDPDDPNADEQYFIALQEYCRSHPSTLIIMDNVNDPAQLNDSKTLGPNLAVRNITPLSLGCNLLFTTRKTFDLPGVTQFPIDILSDEAAYQLLTTNRPPATDEEQNHVKAICNEVGKLPLALVLISARMIKRRNLSFADVHEELVKRSLDVIDFRKVKPEELATRHQAAVTVTLQSQWGELTKSKNNNDAENAQLLFKIAGFFPESAIIPTSRLNLLAGIDSGKSKIDSPMYEALLLLEELNLIQILKENQSTAARIHPLFCDFIKQELILSKEEQSSFKNEAAIKLKTAYDGMDLLVNEYCQRGIDNIIKDLKVAISWCSDDGDDKKTIQKEELKELLWILDLESHNLRVKTNDTDDYNKKEEEKIKKEDANNTDKLKFERALNFAQHLQYRTIKNGLTKIASNAENYLLDLNKPFLKLVWSTEKDSSSLKRIFSGHHGGVYSIAITPDGKLAVSGSSDKTVRIWDIQTGEEKYTLRGHNDVHYVYFVTITPDGKLAVSGSSDGTVRIWDIQTGEEKCTLEDIMIL